MFKRENLINLLIGIVIFLILGAISISLALDPNMGFVKKKNTNNIVMTNEQSEIEIIQEINETNQNVNYN